MVLKNCSNCAEYVPNRYKLYKLPAQIWQLAKIYDHTQYTVASSSITDLHIPTVFCVLPQTHSPTADDEWISLNCLELPFSFHHDPNGDPVERAPIVFAHKGSLFRQSAR